MERGHDSERGYDSERDYDAEIGLDSKIHHDASRGHDSEGGHDSEVATTRKEASAHDGPARPLETRVRLLGRLLWEGLPAIPRAAGSRAGRGLFSLRAG